jgi:hypothetical protein
MKDKLSLTKKYDKNLDMGTFTFFLNKDKYLASN